MDFLNDIAAVVPEGRLNAIIFGSHPFERYRGGERDYGTSDKRDPICVEAAPADYDLPQDGDSLARILSNVRHLRVAPSASKNGPDVMRHAGLFESLYLPTLGTLTHLTIDVEPAPGESVFAHRDSIPKGELTGILRPYNFKKLRHLDLRHCYLPGSIFRMYLSAHKSTLRELRLLGCICGMPSLEFAKWGAQRMRLTGIELCTDVGGQGHRIGGRPLKATASGELFPVTLDARDFTNVRSSVFQLLPQHEIVWLNGRANRIDRESSWNKPWDEDTPWYLQPR
jgi:hypothetical protein